MPKVQVELPEELIRTAKISLDQLSLEVAKVIALELFREEVISIPLGERLNFAGSRLKNSCSLPRTGRSSSIIPSKI